MLIRRTCLRPAEDAEGKENAGDSDVVEVVRDTEAGEVVEVAGSAEGAARGAGGVEEGRREAER